MDELKTLIRTHYKGEANEGDVEFGALVAEFHPLATGDNAERVHWVTEIVRLAGWPTIGFLANDAREVQRLLAQKKAVEAELQATIEQKVAECCAEIDQINLRWGITPVA
jgi:hypothetical protein